MRTFGAMFIGGVAAIVLFKLFAMLVFPVVAIVFGLIGMAIKLALLVGIGWLVYTLVRGRRQETAV
jgi:hypothetical protein